MLHITMHCLLKVVSLSEVCIFYLSQGGINIKFLDIYNEVELLFICIFFPGCICVHEQLYHFNFKILILG